jgi:hypothetical protein
LRTIKIKLTDRIHSRLEEIRSARSVATLEHFFLELALVEIAGFRLLKLEKTQIPDARPVNTPRKFLSAAEEKRRDFKKRTETIIALYDQGLKTGAIAERVRCSPMTVGRVLRRHETEQSA